MTPTCARSPIWTWRSWEGSDLATSSMLCRCDSVYLLADILRCVGSLARGCRQLPSEVDVSNSSLTEAVTIGNYATLAVLLLQLAN